MPPLKNTVQFFQLNPNLQPFFQKRNWQPFDFQEKAWAAYAAAESGLIHAPTGLGKTLAAFLGPLAQELKNPSPQPPSQLRVLWLTPLRALAADTLESLREPVAELAPHLEVEARTGDTSGYRKKKIREKPPFALVTTPESLSLLLTYEDSRSYFENLQCVVIDEWHELMGGKRGVQTELCLARLRHYQPTLRTWGLSATLGNLEESAAVLQGTSSEPSRIIHSQEKKPLNITTLLPKDIERFPWAGHLGTRLVRKVAQQVEKHNSTLLFTNTRSQTEIWYQELASAHPKWGDQLAMHHGSLDREDRDQVEQGLREGKLKCVVCTSSLDLGVDFSPVDLVIQVGSPKGIARLMQRAGRSGHAPGQTSKLICVPTNALELLEFAAARDAIVAADGVPLGYSIHPTPANQRRRELGMADTIHRHTIESRPPLRKPLDLLVQHLVTLLIGEPAHPDDLRREVQTAHAYQNLTNEEWQWALGFITHGGDALKAYPGYRKAELLEDGRYTVTDKRKIQLHRMSIGTITSDQNILVKMGNGKLLGTVEEGFIAKLKPGQQLIFAGRRLEFVRLRAHAATVRPATKKHKGTIATWTGAKMSLSTELTHAISHRLHLDPTDTPETKALAPLLAIQQKWSQLPDDETLLIESCHVAADSIRPAQSNTNKNNEGLADTDTIPKGHTVRRHELDTHHLFLFTFAGRSANEGLGALLAWRITRDTGATVEATQNDYGFSLSSNATLPLDEPTWRDLLTTENLVDDLLACLNATELARRQFRDIARVAGLIVANYPGQRKTGRELQTSSSLLFDVFTNYDPDNLLLEQAQREILERQLELTRLQAVLLTLQTLPIVIQETERLTPFAFPLWADRLQANTTGQDYATRLEAMLTSLEASAD